MNPEHKNIQSWIKKKYSKKYIIEAEIDKQNKLPDAKRRWYQPDIIIRNQKKRIQYIVEVEADPIRKSIVGASILADASLKALDERGTLYFIIYNPKGSKQIPKFEIKAKIAKQYCKNIKKIIVISSKDFKKINL